MSGRDYKVYKNIEFDDNIREVKISGIKDFDTVHLFDSGQAFRWTQNEDGSHTGCAGGRIVNISQKDDVVILKNASEEDFKNQWFDYFDMGRDYGKIKAELSKLDEHLEKAIEFGSGIRIMRQDLWEMIVTFILSANNRIPMIKRAVDGICIKYGREIGEYEGNVYYDFPTPKDLSGLEPGDVRLSGVGFRDKYIVKSANMVNSGEVSLDIIMNSEYEQARAELIKLPGVGDKVADCILLFTKGEMKAYPVDTWVKKLMRVFYGIESENTGEIKRFANEHFKGIQGIAQQYLFYYARENKIK